MKKTITLLLAILMILSLVACGGNGSTSIVESSTPSVSEPTLTPEPTFTPEPTPTSEPEYHVGDTLKGETFEVTLNSIEFCDAFVNDYTQTENELMPALKENADGKTVLGVSSDSYVFLAYSFTYQFVGKTEYEDHFFDMFKPTFTYGDYVYNNDYVEVVKLEEDSEWYGLCLSSNYAQMNNGNGSQLFYRAHKYTKYIPLVSTATYFARGVIAVPSSIQNGDESMALSFSDLSGHFTIDKEECSVYSQREDVVAYLANIDAVDAALQGIWKADDGQNTTITFENGRFIYDYIRYSDEKQEVNEGGYKISVDCITLEYDKSDFAPEIEYSFKNGELLFYTVKGNGDKFQFIKQ